MNQSLKDRSLPGCASPLAKRINLAKQLFPLKPVVYMRLDWECNLSETESAGRSGHQISGSQVSTTQKLPMVHHDFAGRNGTSKVDVLIMYKILRWKKLVLLLAGMLDLQSEIRVLFSLLSAWHKGKSSYFSASDRSPVLKMHIIKLSHSGKGMEICWGWGKKVSKC